jgi:hypothetical protein
MNETVIRLVDAIKSGDVLETEKAFAAAMAEKLAPAIDNYRQEVAANMFKPAAETVEEDVYEDVELSQEEYDALTDDEKQAFTLDEGLGKFVGKVAKGTADAFGNLIGGVAKTVGAIRQTPAAIGSAYNRGRAAAQKSIDK